MTDAIRVGATFGLACSYAGISEDTFARWRAKHADFAEAIKEAEGGAVIKWLALIDKAAAEGTWQAAAWKLERRYPKEYGRTVQEQEHTGGLTIKVVYEDQDGNTSTSQAAPGAAERPTRRAPV